jgi:hypothetical protein
MKRFKRETLNLGYVHGYLFSLVDMDGKQCNNRTAEVIRSDSGGSWCVFYWVDGRQVCLGFSVADTTRMECIRKAKAFIKTGIVPEMEALETCGS